MKETKRKSRDEAGRKKNKKNEKNKMIGANRKRRGGVGLPSKMRKELDRLNPSSDNSDVDEDIDSAVDVYEYEEGLAQEDSKRNRRFDRVENLEYKLPDEFEDENVSSEYDEDSNVRNADANSDEDEDFDDGRHETMLQEITDMPSGTGKKKRNSNVVISEPYPESEYNPSRDVLDGDGQINIEDLLDPLHGKSGYSKLRKRMRQMERKSAPIHAPLSKAEQWRLERKAAAEQSKKDLVKWEPLVKRNREAPTIYFDNKTDLGFSTVGAIASEFEPRTEFEKKIASLVCDDKVMDAHKKDGSRLLELNKVSVEDEKDRQNHIAKMRSLLFRHELKAKRIKKIKSKTYHRLLKKDRLKAASAENQMDPEAAKDLAMKHEYERAKERMTLRHKSSSKWAKRIKERGFDVQDEGTRAAVAEQQHLHALLTRKRNSMRDSSSSSSSEDSSDEDDINENFAGTDKGRASRLLQEAKEKTLKVLNEDDEVPNSGLLSLPFMVRGMKKRNEAAAEEAKLALQDLQSLSKQLEGSSDAEDPKLVPSSGRMVFSGRGKSAPKSSNKTESGGKIKGDRFYDDSDSEDHLEAEENDDTGNSKSNDLQKDVNVDPILLHEDSDIRQGSLFKSFDEIVQDPGPKTTCEVAIFASGTWKKMKCGNNGDATNKKSNVSVQPVLQNQDLAETLKDQEEDSDSDSEGGQMVDGILSSGPKPSYELPSQSELIRQAFAADEVEDDFEKDKMEILNEENPEPEKPVLLPGWGQWTNVQQKKGLPSWMLKEHENAKKKREEALKKRKDASLRNVIISEKLDKKAEKLYTKTLPFPFTSKEVFEQSIRMPIGPEFNPATAVGALNRPEVVKTPGVIIRPIEYENVDPYEKGDHNKQSARKQKKIKGKRKGAN